MIAWIVAFLFVCWDLGWRGGEGREICNEKKEISPQSFRVVQNECWLNPRSFQANLDLRIEPRGGAETSTQAAWPAGIHTLFVGQLQVCRPASSELQGGFLTTGPPGKSPLCLSVG